MIKFNLLLPSNNAELFNARALALLTEGLLLYVRRWSWTIQSSTIEDTRKTQRKHEF